MPLFAGKSPGARRGTDECHLRSASTAARAPSQATEPESSALRIAFRSFAAIEKVGNKLPNPFWLFWILAGVVIVLSAVLAAAGVGTVHPGTHEAIKVAFFVAWYLLGIPFGVG